MNMTGKNLGYLEGWLSVVINTTLFGFKYWAGVKFGSVAMVADAWHTLSDTLTSLVVILGFWIAARPPDKDHPFGHGRAESIAAIVIATALAMVAVDFIQESIGRLRHNTAATFSLVAILIFLVSVIVKEALARFSFWAGRKVNSQSLKADGWHHRSDAIASALIVVGALFARKFWWIDGVMGIGISLLILYAAVDILRGAAGVLLGEKHADRLEQEITDAIRGYVPDVATVHHVHMHRYGDHAEVTLHVRLPPNIHLKRAHEIATRAENAIREKMGLEATVHVEPAAEA